MAIKFEDLTPNKDIEIALDQINLEIPVPINPVKDSNVAYDMAKAEEPWRNKAAHISAHMPKGWLAWLLSSEKRRDAQVEIENLNRRANEASALARQEIAEENPELFDSLYTLHQD